MKILLLGGSGQLGIEIRSRALDLNLEIISPISAEVNINNLSQILHLVNECKPDVIVNCAAYTAVDLAESEPDKAYATNCDGIKNICTAASEINAFVIHISTDYVFSGLNQTTPYTENDPTDPLSIYGKSKLAGEQFVVALGTKGAVLRTSSLFGRKPPNFVLTMIDLFKKNGEVKVVSDIIMTPTWAGWLAETIIDLVRLPLTGIIHASCTGAISWFEFAQAILSRVQIKGIGTEVILIPILAKDYPRAAMRPSYSVMSTDKLAKHLGRSLLSWERGLDNVLKEVL
jgi:dTDP-4-dehydrorhamnose reductase